MRFLWYLSYEVSINAPNLYFMRRLEKVGEGTGKFEAVRDSSRQFEKVRDSSRKFEKVWSTLRETSNLKDYNLFGGFKIQLFVKM